MGRPKKNEIELKNSFSNEKKYEKAIFLKHVAVTLKNENGYYEYFVFNKGKEIKDKDLINKILDFCIEKSIIDVLFE